MKHTEFLKKCYLAAGYTEDEVAKIDFSKITDKEASEKIIKKAWCQGDSP